jgi:hypothetical protein
MKNPHNHKIKYVYTIKIIDKYPDCDHCPDYVLDSVFYSKEALSKAIRRQRMDFPGSFNIKDYEIEKIESDKMHAARYGTGEEVKL